MQFPSPGIELLVVPADSCFVLADPLGVLLFRRGNSSQPVCFLDLMPLHSSFEGCLSGC
jgi:hypothetical protein